MQRYLFRSVLLAGLSGVLLTAQTASSGMATTKLAIREHLQAEEEAILGVRDLRIAADLGLTADQATKVRAAFEEAAEVRRGVAQQDRDLRKQLAAAVKSGDQGMIDQISEAMGKILEEQMACQAKTVAKVYEVLTPEQRTKLEQEAGKSLGLIKRSHQRQPGL